MTCFRFFLLALGLSLATSLSASTEESPTSSSGTAPVLSTITDITRIPVHTQAADLQADTLVHQIAWVCVTVQDLLGNEAMDPETLRDTLDERFDQVTLELGDDYIYIVRIVDGVPREVCIRQDQLTVQHGSMDEVRLSIQTAMTL